MATDKQMIWTRNLLAFSLVGAFVGGIIAFTFYAIPESNRDIITYMVGQLSGMATMALGFYYVGRNGQAVNKGTEEDPLIIEGTDNMVPVKTRGEKK